MHGSDKIAINRVRLTGYSGLACTEDPPLREMCGKENCAVESIHARRQANPT